MKKIYYHVGKVFPKPLKFFLAKNFFGLTPDIKNKVGKTIKHNRLTLAARYIQGSGIEIGGLTRPMALPPSTKVKYVDRLSLEDLSENYIDHKNKKKIRKPDIVANAETLDPIADNSQDFLIANHVLEHIPNPILFFHNATRVLKTGGVLFLAIPNKEMTFDRNRSVTSFEHLERDFTEGPAQSRTQHFEEFVALADCEVGTWAWKTQEEKTAWTKKLLEMDYSVHYHVWDTPAMMDMFLKLRTAQNLPLMPLTMLTSGDEVIFIVEKR